MNSECVICFEKYPIKKFIFCNICSNIFCKKCVTEIKRRSNRYPICRETLDFRKDIMLRRSFSIIEGKKYKGNKDLIATA
jgi:hypothetical protein